MTGPLQLGRSAGDALTLAITWPLRDTVLNRHDFVAAQVHGSVGLCSCK